MLKLMSLKKIALLEISDSNTTSIKGGTDGDGTVTRLDVTTCGNWPPTKTTWDWDDEGTC